MDLTEKFLPNEKLIKDYTQITINKKSQSSLFITNLRIFIIQHNGQFWEIMCKNIDHFERTFVNKFSWWWQLILMPIALIALINSNILLFGIISMLSMARQYIKLESLVIHTKVEKWSISDNNQILDEISNHIQMNALIGKKTGDGEIILDAEELIQEVNKIPIVLVGENESRPFTSAWISIIMAFLAYYMSSFGIKTNFLIFIFTISAIFSFIMYRDRKIRNQYRKVEPKPGVILQLWHFVLNYLNIKIIKADWSFKLFYTQIKARQLGYYICCAFILLGFLLTYTESNMIPLLLGITIGAPIYLTGRVLAGIPRSRYRMVLRTVSCFTIALIIVIPCLSLMPFYAPANAHIPNSVIKDNNEGWKKSMEKTDNYGLGLLSTTFLLYADDGRDDEGNDDGYPALLFVIALKLPLDLEEKDALNELDKQFNNMAIEQEIELDTELDSGKRKTKQGYETQYIIYNGTAKTEEFGIGNLNYSITKGSESRYIGEVWKAPEHNLLIVTIGLAVISSESLNDDTGIEPIDNIIDDFIPNPTDSTNTQNWDELLELIPEVVCYKDN